MSAQLPADTTAMIDTLPHGWFAVPVGAADDAADHLLVGPGGVYAVQTKRHAGSTVWGNKQRLLVNGQRTNYLEAARLAAQRISMRISKACGTLVEAKAALVFEDVAGLNVRRGPSDVAVTTAARIREFLTQQPQRLSASQVSRIVSNLAPAATLQVA
jgi:Nuclease-related domain